MKNPPTLTSHSWAAADDAATHRAIALVQRSWCFKATSPCCLGFARWARPFDLKGAPFGWGTPWLVCARVGPARSPPDMAEGGFSFPVIGRALARPAAMDGVSALSRAPPSSLLFPAAGGIPVKGNDSRHGCPSARRCTHAARLHAPVMQRREAGKRPLPHAALIQCCLKDARSAQISAREGGLTT